MASAARAARASDLPTREALGCPRRPELPHELSIWCSVCEIKMGSGVFLPNSGDLSALLGPDRLFIRLEEAKPCMCLSVAQDSTYRLKSTDLIPVLQQQVRMLPVWVPNLLWDISVDSLHLEDALASDSKCRSMPSISYPILLNGLGTTQLVCMLPYHRYLARPGKLFRAKSACDGCPFPRQIASLHLGSLNMAGTHVGVQLGFGSFSLILHILTGKVSRGYA